MNDRYCFECCRPLCHKCGSARESGFDGFMKWFVVVLIFVWLQPGLRYVAAIATADWAATFHKDVPEGAADDLRELSAMIDSLNAR